MRGWTTAAAMGLAVLGTAPSASAALPEWRSVTPFEITNPGIGLSDVQVELTINTQALVTAGRLDLNANDMRFASDCVGDNLVPFWIQPGTFNTTATRVWVRVDLSAGQTLLLRMFHENAAAPNAMSAIEEIFDGPHSANGQISGGMESGITTNSQRGFRFSAGRDLLVTEFGKNEPTGTTRSVTLWNVADGAALQTELVSGEAAQYSYGAVAEPFWLDSGGDYVLSIFQAGSAERYYFQPSTQIGQYLTYGEMRFCNDCTALTFPQLVLADYHYGYPDIRFFIKQEPPATLTVDPNVSCSNEVLCDADCSAAICGDDFINRVAGEECDDGSIINGDGCSSACLLEVEPGSSSGGGSSTGGSGTTTGTEATVTGPADSSSGPAGTPNPTTSTTGAATTDPAVTGSAATGDPPAGTGGIPGLPTRGLGETGCSCASGNRAPTWGAFVLLMLLRRRRVSS